MTERTKYLAVFLFPVLVCLTGMVCLNAMWQSEYRRTSYQSLSGFGETMVRDYPELEEAFFASLKEYRTERVAGDNPVRAEYTSGDFLGRYGYTEEHFYSGAGRGLSYFAAIAAILMSAVFLLSVLYMWCSRRRRVAELTDYLEQVNLGAAGTVIQTAEDGFSRLQDEIYKTVTNLCATREAAVRAKENFAENLANIAHQLKTPLTAALLSLQLMKKTPSDAHRDAVEKQLKRLNQLEEALLTLSKIDSGALRLEKCPVDVYTVLNLAAENLADLTAKENIFIEIPDKGCVEVCGDMEWTMEALMNLMKNCMEHSPRGGAVHCDYAQNPLYAEILIWDEGKGFAREDLPCLFRRFYRGADAGGNGTGLGLALAHSIFELQNGSLTARNLPSGGACFEIRIYRH